MMPTFYANSVLIHLNDTGEISHEIGEEAFMSETIKIIQGGPTASLMKMRLMAWDYECSPNSIYIVCPVLSHYICQWLLFPAAWRAVRLVRRLTPTSAPQESLSLCCGFRGHCVSRGDGAAPLFCWKMPLGRHLRCHTRGPSRPGTCCGQVDMLMPTLDTCRELLPSSCSREKGTMPHTPAM